MSASMSEYLQQFDALSVRERALILVTILVAILMPTVMYVIEPAQKVQLKTTTQIAKLKAENANKFLDIQTLTASKNKDPNQLMRTQIQQRRQQLVALNQKLHEQSEQLVSPQVMLGVLEHLLANYQGVDLVSVNKAEPQRFSLSTGEGGAVESSEQTQPESNAGLYRHDLTVVIKGGFFEVLTYLKTLEALPRGFFWDSIDYQVQTYPEAEVSLKIHTLSMDRGWLGV
ncbi:MAG: hypothetical protein V7677_19325 [Motiliproteus sp.]